MSNKHTKSSYPWNFKISPLSRDFRVFRAIFEARSLTVAAETLSMDQGNLSKILKRLESQFEFKLFARHRGGLIPTKNGDALMRALKSMDQVWDGARKGAFDNLEPKILRIGAHQIIAQTYFPSIVSKIMEDRSDIYPEFVFGTSFNITRKIRNREIDLGIVVTPVESTDLIIRNLAKEDIELCGLDKDTSDVTLLTNPQMLDLRSITKQMNFRNVLDVDDYNVAAAMSSGHPMFWSLIPSTVRGQFPNLQTIKKVRRKLDIKLVTYPGSPLSGKLTQLQKAYSP